ncbi:hypothetical protein GCM10029976_010750 [Kribbella albertanoniae]
MPCTVVLAKPSALPTSATPSPLGAAARSRSTAAARSIDCTLPGTPAGYRSKQRVALGRLSQFPAYCAALGTAPRRTGGKATMEKHRGLPSSAPMHRTEHMLATARN